MRNILKALSAGALALAALAVPASAALVVNNPAPPAVPAPAMWEVSDADSKIYLFGSVHILPAGVQWRTPLFNRTLDAADEVYFETDIGPLGMMALTFKMVALGFQTINTHWVRELTPAQLAQLRTAIKPLGFSLEQVDSYPPWVLDLQLSDAAMNTDAPSEKRPDLANGVDPTLQWELPKERKAYLETPGQQYDFLASDPLDVQIKRLFEDINASGGTTAEGQFDLLMQHWIKGDVDFLVETVQGVGPEDAALEKRILYDRNNNWIPTLEKLLADNKQDLIVVGAAHLAGPGSVLDLLGKAGYTVRRIQ